MADVRAETATADSSRPPIVAPAREAGAAIDTRLPSMWSETTILRVIVLLVVVGATMFLVPSVLSAFWLQIALKTVTYSAVALGLGILVGRAGMFSLAQIPVVAVGVWFSLRLQQQWNLPFPLLLIFTGLLTGVVGAVIGFPALRLRGLYLALITLMGAGAITLLLQTYKFPNGGSGFWGFDKSIPSGTTVLNRPELAQGDTAYYRYCVVVVAILFVVVTWHIRGKPGRAWAAIRQSQVTAVAAGVDTVLYKLWCFFLSASITGVAGALLAASPGGVTVTQFPVQDSIILLAVVLMGGVYSIWGAVIAAFFLAALPRLLDIKVGIPPEFLVMLFGVGVIQVLTTAPGGVAGDLQKLGKLLNRKLRPGKHQRAAVQASTEAAA
jgi:branched-chain amino acid transport system permease protein